MRVFTYYYSNSKPIYCNLIIKIFRYLSKIFDLRKIFTANLKNYLVDYTNFNYAKLLDN